MAAGKAEVRIIEYVAKDVPASRSAELDVMEAEFQTLLESQGDLLTRFRCAAAGYLPRPLLYKGGENSILVEAAPQEPADAQPVASYVASMKKVWFEGEVTQSAFGYLARILPGARNQGLGTILFQKVAERCARDNKIGSCVIARDNYPQLKVMLRTAQYTGQTIVAEQAIYIVSPAAFPEKPLPEGAAIERVDSVAALDALFEQIYGRDNLRLADSEEILSARQHGGHFVIRQGDSSAGFSVWNPDYAVTVSPTGERSPYSLFYNAWFQGDHGLALLEALYSNKLRASGFPYCLVSIFRTTPSATFTRPEPIEGLPTYATSPIEKLIAPHAIGLEEEFFLNGFLSYPVTKLLPKLPMAQLFFDPRDFSSLLGFHKIPASFDF